MYLSARRLGISPSEFWDMTLGELTLEIVEHNKAHAPSDGRGLAAEDVARLREMQEEDARDGIA